MGQEGGGGGLREERRPVREAFEGSGAVGLGAWGATVCGSGGW
jgi:hypothetical protein